MTFIMSWNRIRSMLLNVKGQKTAIVISLFLLDFCDLCTLGFFDLVTQHLAANMQKV